MNVNEFKAWFEGFTDNLDGSPGPKAWEKIIAKVKSLVADAPPLPTYVPYYYYPHQPWTPCVPNHAQPWTCGVGMMQSNTLGQNLTMLNSSDQTWYVLGKSDAQAS